MPPGGRQPRRGWENTFFEAWKKSGLVVDGCKAANISQSFVYKQRRENPEFAERWADEEERVTEVLEQIAIRRAGESSDTLLIFLLKARRPEVYRENVHVQHDHQVHGTVTLEVLDGHDPIEFDAAQRRAAAKALLAGDDVIEGQVVAEIPQETAA